MSRKTVLITGGTRGIGLATARMFVQMGYDVAVCSSTAASSIEVIKINGTDVLALKADVSDTVSVNEMVKTVLSEYGHLDVLVNNAGISQIKLFTDITDDDFSRMTDVNLKGVFNCSRAVVPHMVRRKSGSIVNVSSMWGVHGASCEVHYSAAKAGVIGMTKALALELAPSGIRVNCVAPGAIETDMNKSFTADERRDIENEIPLGRFGTAEEIANVIFFLASDASSYITGTVIEATGGI